MNIILDSVISINNWYKLENETWYKKLLTSLKWLIFIKDQ